MAINFKYALYEVFISVLSKSEEMGGNRQTTTSRSTSYGRYIHSNQSINQSKGAKERKEKKSRAEHSKTSISTTFCLRKKAKKKERKNEMKRRPRSAKEADQLLALSECLRSVALTVMEEWAKEDFSASAPSPSQFLSAASATKDTTNTYTDTARVLPSARLWEAEKTIEAVSGTLVGKEGEWISKLLPRKQALNRGILVSATLFSSLFYFFL